MTKRFLVTVLAVEFFTSTCGVARDATSEVDRAALQAEAESSGSFVAGQVTDAQNEAPLAGVTISGGQGTTTSAATETNGPSLFANGSVKYATATAST